MQRKWPTRANRIDESMKSTISQLKRGCRAVFIDRRIPSAVLDRLASGTRLAARARLAVTNQFHRLRYRFSMPIPPAELMHRSSEKTTSGASSQVVDRALRTCGWSLLVKRYSCRPSHPFSISAAVVAGSSAG